MKYAAKSVAKNMSSLDSQTIVPTVTYDGRPSTPWSLDAGIAEVVAT